MRGMWPCAVDVRPRVRKNERSRPSRLKYATNLSSLLAFARPQGKGKIKDQEQNTLSDVLTNSWLMYRDALTKRFVHGCKNFLTALL